MKKNNSEIVVESLFGAQPSNREPISSFNNAASLTEYEYEYLKRELNSYYNRGSKSFYDNRNKSKSVDWRKPQVTRSKEELYSQLKFYDIVKTKEKLSISQLNEIDKEVKQIYSELLQIDGYEYFLKYGHEKLRIDKLNRWEDPRNIRFYQREMDIIYDNTINEYVNIVMPIEKWWIVEDDLKKHSIDVNDANQQFVNIEAKNKISSYDVEPIEIINREDRENFVVESDDAALFSPDLVNNEKNKNVQTNVNNKKQNNSSFISNLSSKMFKSFSKSRKNNDIKNSNNKLESNQVDTQSPVSKDNNSNDEINKINGNQNNQFASPQTQTTNNVANGPINNNHNNEKQLPFPPPSPNNFANNFRNNSNNANQLSFPPPSPNNLANNFVNKQPLGNQYNSTPMQQTRPQNKQFFDYQK